MDQAGTLRAIMQNEVTGWEVWCAPHLQKRLEDYFKKTHPEHLVEVLVWNQASMHPTWAKIVVGSKDPKILQNSYLTIKELALTQDTHTVYWLGFDDLAPIQLNETFLKVEQVVRKFLLIDLVNLGNVDLQYKSESGPDPKIWNKVFGDQFD